MSTSKTETLRHIAQIASEKHNSAGGRQMFRIADKAGHVMSPTTFDRILNGAYTSRPQKKTLEALAYLAGVSEKRVYEAAGRRYVSDRFADQLPPDVDLLTDDQRNAVITVARAFLNANREIEGLQNELEHTEHPPEELPDNVREGRFRAAGEEGQGERHAPASDISPEVDERSRVVAREKKAAKRPHPNIAPDELGHST